jgi:amino acid transporter
VTLTRNSTAPPTTEQHQVGLKKNVLGFPALFAQSVALISPTMTAVLIIPLAFSNAGEGTWLAYGFGTVMLLFVVFCLNQFAKRSSSAGTMYAYTGRGLGPTAGVFSGWTLIWSYLFIAVAGMCGFAVFSQQLLSALGYHGTVPPIIFFAISALAGWFIAFKDIRVSSILTLVLEAASVACILSLACIILFKHGFVVDTAQTHLHGVKVHGMALAVVACIFSLVGFESATTLSGESKNPLKNVPKAVIWSLIATGLFFVFMSDIYGVSWFKIPLSIGAMVSFFGLSLSCLNAGSRIIYPMARHGIFSAHLGKAHATNRTPHIAVTVYMALIFLVPTFLEIFTNPLTTFGDAGTLAAFGFLLAYFLITIAAPVYLKKIGELRPGHIVLAVVAVICLMVPTIGSFYPLPPYPVRTFPYIFLAWMLIGGGWLYIVSRRRPGILSEIESDLERGPEPEDVLIDIHDSVAEAQLIAEA